MGETNVIPVVMVSDQHFVYQTRTAIWSMRKAAASTTLLKITILCSTDLDGDSRQILKELQSVLSNVTIDFYEVDPRRFSGAKTTGYIPVTSYYRLLLGEIVREDKCLFLDGDLIIRTDLNRLYSVPMEEDYVAGVRELGFVQDKEKAENHGKEFGFPSMDHYVNAGVMLFHLAKIREDKLQDRFMQELKRQYTYMDQDIINRVCYGNIKLLDLGYNVPACHVRFDRLCFDTNITKEQIEETVKNWGILHFLGAYKPWEYVRTWGARVWWRYAREALPESVWKPMYEKAQEITGYSDWSYVLDRCGGQKDIVLVCYYDVSLDVYESLLRCGVHSAFHFCDNAGEKQGRTYDGVTVCSVTETASRYPHALWINTSQANAGQINRQLKDLGIEGERIVTYKAKTDIYYMAVDEEFRAYENRQRNLKETGRID